jgi:hypothetical protein
VCSDSGIKALSDRCTLSDKCFLRYDKLSSLGDGVEFVRGWWEGTGVSGVSGRLEIDSCIVVHK